MRDRLQVGTTGAGASGEDYPCYTLKIRSGCDGGGKGPLIQTNKSATLSCNNDQYLFVPSICLNDQGGAVMNVTYNKTDTLRAQTHGHEPIVLSIAENQQACVTLHEEKANCISVGRGKPGQGYPCILVKIKR